TRFPGRRRAGRECENGARQSGAEYHPLSRRTGNGLADDVIAHSNPGSERQDETVANHRRATERPDPQLVVLARSEWPRIRERFAPCADEELQRAHASVERPRQGRERQRPPRRSAELAS